MFFKILRVQLDLVKEKLLSLLILNNDLIEFCEVNISSCNKVITFDEYKKKEDLRKIVKKLENLSVLLKKMEKELRFL